MEFHQQFRIRHVVILLSSTFNTRVNLPDLMSETQFKITVIIPNCSILSHGPLVRTGTGSSLLEGGVG